MSDCTKCKLNKKIDLIGCDGPCQRWWHYSCAKLSEVEFKFLSKNDNVVFICDSCKKNGDATINTTTISNLLVKEMTTISKNMEVQCEAIVSSVLSKIEEMFSSLKIEMMHLVKSDSSSSTETTYAKVSRNKPTLIITPKDASQCSNITKSVILQNVDPIKENLMVKQVHDVSNGGIAVRCDNETKLIDLVNSKLSNEYHVKQVSPIHPRVRISGLSEKLEGVTLFDMLKSQNSAIFDTNSYVKFLSIDALRKNKNVFHATFETDVETYHRFLSAGYVIIGFDYCKVYDAIDIRRCFKCCGFHHLASKCSSEAPICPRCAGNHALADCNNVNLKCSNCTKHNTRSNVKKVRVDHAVWDKSCEVYKTALNSFKNRILDKQ